VFTQAAASWCLGWVETAFQLIHDTSRQQLGWTLPDTVNIVKCSWWWRKYGPKHVELTRNNKLTCIVASCWLLSYLSIYLFIYISVLQYKLRPSVLRWLENTFFCRWVYMLPKWHNIFCITNTRNMCLYLKPALQQGF